MMGYGDGDDTNGGKSTSGTAGAAAAGWHVRLLFTSGKTLKPIS